MAQNTHDNELTITAVKASSIALFEGTLASMIGLFVALLYALRVTVNLSQETSSVL